MLPPDQVIEQTINRDLKCPGGIIGFTTLQGSIQRWILSSYNTSSVIADCRQSFELDNSDQTPKEMNTRKINFDERSVERCKDIIINWKNPFEISEPLFCLSSGLVASQEVEE